MKINKHALTFGLITTFLTGLGFTIISPVVPFMVAPFANAHDQALIVTSLMASMHYVLSLPLLLLVLYQTALVVNLSY